VRPHEQFFYLLYLCIGESLLTWLTQGRNMYNMTHFVQSNMSTVVDELEFVTANPSNASRVHFPGSHELTGNM